MGTLARNGLKSTMNLATVSFNISFKTFTNYDNRKIYELTAILLCAVECRSFNY